MGKVKRGAWISCFDVSLKRRIRRRASSWLMRLLNLELEVSGHDEKFVLRVDMLYT
jgi:hypothetical protein